MFAAINKRVHPLRLRAKHFVWKAGRKRVLHFVHIGKTGGTALIDTLSRAHRTSPQYRIFFHPHHFTLHDVPAGEGAIFFLRDPITRFVSGFYGRQRQDYPRYNSPWRPGEKIAFEQFSAPQELALALSSEDPVEKNNAVQAMHNIAHVNTHYSFWLGSMADLERRADDIFFVGFQEQFNNHFEELRVSLQLPDSVSLPNDQVRSHRNPDGLDRSLNEQATKNLRDWYAEDYQYYEFCKALR